MRPQPSTPLALLAAATIARAHSWVEVVHRIAPGGGFVGDPGYARGWVSRDSKDPVFSDKIPQHLLPDSSAYTGNEILNKYPYTDKPNFPMLQAAPGDYIALLNFENGHVTLNAQPKKPLNRGTVFVYGTADPKPEERLFDVHLAWTRDGTGGDKRGRLLHTRNYDDGQCYEPNTSPRKEERVKQGAAEGAVDTKALACQSDLQLPEDLKPGSTYTLYWYWDWPDLDPDHIDVAATKNGKFPWAGTFQRGEKDPNGFTLNAISKNESYASTVDIKIIEAAQLPGGAGAVAKAAAGWKSDANIYTQAIKAQMANNYQVDVDGNGATGGGSATATATASSASTPDAAAPPSTPAGGPVTTSSANPVPHPAAPTSTLTAPSAAPAGSGSGGVTVTTTVTLPAKTVVETVYVTASGPPASSASPDSSVTGRSQPAVYANMPIPRDAPPATVTEKHTCVATVTKMVPKADASAPPPPGRRRRHLLQ
ncbi:hypothetical protein ISF_09413 [Cordyceps fumosorosea ARSEF 2679]|uniref:DUF7492 domain-containing protein n=1 Tax=Cordyceps fumosorosea (strain ARSEF 2679) TaxID=1081104 RepID=A0A162M2R3_CORFA|nr:hypothetical protein ISF_09413 [Cordyceps fumosorosea ARSEF 2679]OAA49710.1 hypothetical protein ISF_09413 [Cordyceps fumosorosea ARSEF 2679]